MFYICSVNIMQYIHYFIRSVWFRGFFFTCKLLYYELYYEKKLGIQTLHIENLENLDTLNDDYENNHHYQGASYHVLSILFDEIKKYTSSKSILDYGCGKGRVMIMATVRGYTEVYGIDLAKELCEISKKNIQIVQSRYPNTHFSVIQADATVFSDIDQIDIFFFFNPFGRPILIEVIKQIKESNSRNHRNIFIIYVNPLFVDCFIHEGFTISYELKSKDYMEGMILKLKS